MEQRELLLAQNYLVKLKQNLVDPKNMSLLDTQEKSAYEKVFNSLSRGFSPSNTIEYFLSEKGYNIEGVFNILIF